MKGAVACLRQQESRPHIRPKGRFPGPAFGQARLCSLGRAELFHSAKVLRTRKVPENKGFGMSLRFAKINRLQSGRSGQGFWGALFTRRRPGGGVVLG